LNVALQERKNKSWLISLSSLFGCTSLRRLEDVGNKQATQFALFKAFASSNPRLTGRSRKEVVRFERFPRRPNNQWST
jgi:hypothetical protein